MVWLPRSSVGVPAWLQCFNVTSRWSGSDRIPTLERGNENKQWVIWLPVWEERLYSCYIPKVINCIYKFT